MSVLVVGNGGVVLDVDEARNAQIFQAIAGYPTAGGFFSVTGMCTSVVAASLAADTSLATARFAAASTRKAYLTRAKFNAILATAGAAGGIATIMGLQRFTTATPTGGTARTPHRYSAAKGSTTDMTDVRDSNAALTVTSVVFGDVVDSFLLPNGSTNVAPALHIFEPKTPVELAAGDGLAFRTRNAGPGTATWVFQYTLEWFER